MSDAALESGRTAVVTGAASGIGLAACRRFRELGMKVCMADVDDHMGAFEAEDGCEIREYESFGFQDMGVTVR